MAEQLSRLLLGLLVCDAVERRDTRAAREILRHLRRPLPLGLSGGLSTTAEITTAANALLKAVADGTISPQDAQRTVAVIEMARRAVETQDLDARVAALERSAKSDSGRRRR